MPTKHGILTGFGSKPFPYVDRVIAQIDASARVRI